MSVIVEVSLAGAAGTLAAGSVALCGAAHIKEKLKKSSEKAKKTPQVAKNAFTTQADRFSKIQQLSGPISVECAEDGGRRVRTTADVHGEVLVKGADDRLDSGRPLIELGGSRISRQDRVVHVSVPAREVTLTFDGDKEAGDLYQKMIKASKQLKAADRIFDLTKYVHTQEKQLKELGKAKDKLFQERTSLKKKSESQAKKNEALEHNAEEWKKKCEIKTECKDQPHDHLRRLRSLRDRFARHTNSGLMSEEAVSPMSPENGIGDLVDALEAKSRDVGNMAAGLEQRVGRLECMTDGQDRNVDISHLPPQDQVQVEHLETQLRQAYDDIRNMEAQLNQVYADHQGIQASHGQLTQQVNQAFADRDLHISRLQEEQRARSEDQLQFEEEYKALVCGHQQQLEEREARGGLDVESYRELERHHTMLQDEHARVQGMLQEHQNMVQDRHARVSALEAELASRPQTDQHMFAQQDRIEGLEHEILSLRRQAAEAQERVDLHAGELSRAHAERSALEDQYRQQAQRHEEAIQDYAQRVRSYEADSVRSGGYPQATPQDLEKMATLEEENRMMKEQMANSWNQINGQMARLDEEHARFADEVRQSREEPYPVMTSQSGIIPGQLPTYSALPNGRELLTGRPVMGMNGRGGGESIDGDSARYQTAGFISREEVASFAQVPPVRFSSDRSVRATPSNSYTTPSNTLHKARNQQGYQSNVQKSNVQTRPLDSSRVSTLAGGMTGSNHSSMNIPATMGSIPSYRAPLMSRRG
jgi:hypothetical protein